MAAQCASASGHGLCSLHELDTLLQDAGAPDLERISCQRRAAHSAEAAVMAAWLKLQPHAWRCGIKEEGSPLACPALQPGGTTSASNACASQVSNHVRGESPLSSASGLNSLPLAA